MERAGDESVSSGFFSCGPTGMPGKICQIFEAVMNTHRRGFYEKYIKLPQDTVLALLALAVLSPVLGLVALAVRLHLGAPVLFRQERAGKDGRSFTLYKFRTMSDQRDAAGALLPDEQRLDGFGRFLRSTSLDELPSLWNVVSGSCALCGPRPLYVKYVPLYSPRQARRLWVRPGLTGLAQVSGRNAIGWEEKFSYDVRYVERITFWGDWRILFKTVRMVLCREGITAPGCATAEEFKGGKEARAEHEQAPCDPRRRRSWQSRGRCRAENGLPHHRVPG